MINVPEWVVARLDRADRERMYGKITLHIEHGKIVRLETTSFDKPPANTETEQLSKARY